VDWEVEDNLGNPKPRTPLVKSTNEMLLSVTMPKACWGKVIPATLIVSLATKPPAAVPSAYETPNTVALFSTAKKVGLEYAKGYLGRALQGSEMHSEDITQRSALPVSNATLKLISPSLITV
jgi:hypothetical protein